MILTTTTIDSSPATPANQNILGAIAYLGFFVTGIILLLVEKKNDYVRFHAMQSTIFFGGLFIVEIALMFIPVVFIWGLNSIIGLIWLISVVVLAWKAFNGERYKLPYVGEMAEKQLAKMK